MKPENDIPKLIRKMRIKASAELDRRVYNDISEAAVAGPTIWRVITKGGAMKLAIAAAIVIAFGVGFFIGQRSQLEQAAIYSLDVTGEVSMYPTESKSEDGFWRRKVATAMQPRPYTGGQFDKTSLVDTYKQYLKEKHYG